MSGQDVIRIAYNLLQIIDKCSIFLEPAVERKVTRVEAFRASMVYFSDATFDRHWSRIVYLISFNLFVEMSANLCIIYSL
jgi:hypothetical protein